MVDRAATCDPNIMVDLREQALLKSVSGRRGEVLVDRDLAHDLADIRRARNGDQYAFGRLIDRYERRVSTILWRFSRDPEAHQDLVQETFIEAYQSLPTFRGKAPFEHWLARIATRVGYRYWKRQQRERVLEVVPIEEWDRLADEQQLMEVTPEDAASLLERLLVHLQPRDRLVLTLRYIDGLSPRETAHRTGWSETMVNVQAWRARRKLQALLEQARKERGQ
ncbi:MAG: RNA polymerase sigma factor [Candidatus Zipacnadales bacterium]